MVKKIIKVLSEWLSKYIGLDGLMHFAVSAVLTAVLSIFLTWWLSALITLVIGVAKELWDAYSENGSGFSIKDLICDVLGILVVL